MTVAYKKETVGYGDNRYVVERWSQASGDNAAQTCTTAPAADARAPVQPRRLIAVLVKYTNTVTKTCTVTLNSGIGPTYDGLLGSIALNVAASGSFLPAVPIDLFSDDVIDVYCPAAGVGGELSQVVIITQVTEL